MKDELTQIQREQGATLLADPRGNERAALFCESQKEIDAFQDSAVLFDLSTRSQFQITGSDRATFLHGFCTNEIKKMTPGQGCEAIVTNIKSRILGHVFISCRENDLWIDSSAGSEEPLIAHLDKYLITEDVELVPRSDQQNDFLLAGPNAKMVLESLGWLKNDLQPNEHLTVPSDSVQTDSGELLIRCVDWLNGEGFLISVSAETAMGVWKMICEQHVQPAGWKTFETLRIENKFPDYGRDMTDDHLAQELGRDQKAISFQKGCYLGQEPIARLDAMGHVNKILTKFYLETSNTEEIQSLVGLKLFDSSEEKELGQLTSVAWDRDDKGLVALGFARTRETEPGMELVGKMSSGDTVKARIAKEE